MKKKYSWMVASLAIVIVSVISLANVEAPGNPGNLLQYVIHHSSRGFCSRPLTLTEYNEAKVNGGLTFNPPFKISNEWSREIYFGIPVTKEFCLKGYSTKEPPYETIQDQGVLGASIRYRILYEPK